MAIYIYNSFYREHILQVTAEKRRQYYNSFYREHILQVTAETAYVDPSDGKRKLKATPALVLHGRSLHLVSQAPKRAGLMKLAMQEEDTQRQSAVSLACE